MKKNSLDNTKSLGRSKKTSVENWERITGNKPLSWIKNANKTVSLIKVFVCSWQIGIQRVNYSQKNTSKCSRLNRSWCRACTQNYFRAKEVRNCENSHSCNCKQWRDQMGWVQSWSGDRKEEQQVDDHVIKVRRKIQDGRHCDGTGGEIRVKKRQTRENVHPEEVECGGDVELGRRVWHLRHLQNTSHG